MIKGFDDSLIFVSKIEQKSLLLISEWTTLAKIMILFPDSITRDFSGNTSHCFAVGILNSSPEKLWLRDAAYLRISMAQKYDSIFYMIRFYKVSRNIQDRSNIDAYFAFCEFAQNVAIFMGFHDSFGTILFS
ncbi:MAG: hypothetical protein HXS41_12970 [Theionarchaea archaeon]|nr:hypothetical protein [Theionarchaea archaeon]MBU7001677.1 hypothetical protein [Theionarchaea archaeon]MBU7021964.1 hypothetical protein [Theionarchaea archaeon]MBU7041650.1 hypothetical protein [Theionarchaea archaeon]